MALAHRQEDNQEIIRTEEVTHPIEIIETEITEAKIVAGSTIPTGIGLTVAGANPLQLLDHLRMVEVPRVILTPCRKRISSRVAFPPERGRTVTTNRTVSFKEASLISTVIVPISMMIDPIILLAKVSPPSKSPPSTMYPSTKLHMITTTVQPTIPTNDPIIIIL